MNSKLERLQRRCAEGRSLLWELVDIVDLQGDAKLKCKACKKVLSSVNPAQTFKQHFPGGKCMMLKNKRKASDDGSTINAFMASSKQTSQAIRYVCRFIFKNNVAFKLIEDDELRKAFNVFGVDLPSRKALSERYLPAEHAIVVRNVEKCLEQAKSFGISSDGWRSKFCGEGQPLTNYCALLPGSGSVFMKVTWGAEHNLFDEHDAIIAQYGRKVIGVVCDNAASNVKMQRNLEEKYRWIICVGCAAHALNLFLKDIDDIRKGAKKMRGILHDADRIGTMLRNDREVRALLAERSSKTHVSSYCETRFGTWSWILKDVLMLKNDLQGVVLDDRFGVEKHGELKNLIIGGGKFWNMLEHTHEFFSHVVGILQSLEVDSGLLSHVPEAYRKIAEHVEKLPEELKSEIEPLLEARRAKHVRPCHKAAHALDPAFAIRSTSGEWMLNVGDMEERQEIVAYLEKFVDSEELVKLHCEWGEICVDGLPGAVHDLVEHIMRERKGGSGAMLWMHHLHSKYPMLARCAHPLLTLHATSASSERNWSTWTNVFTAKRNRLSLDNGESLVFVRQNMKVNTSEK